MSTELSRLTERAKADKTTRFLSMAHLLTPDALLEAFRGLRKDASAGVDEVTYAEYEQATWTNVQQLHDRLVSHQYRAQPLRRVYIPKENGKERPISIPSLEDKIVQKATVKVLNAVYEQDFLTCSYGFRPGRSPHDALDAVGRIICRGPMAYVRARSRHLHLLRRDCAKPAHGAYRETDWRTRTLTLPVIDV